MKESGVLNQRSAEFARHESRQRLHRFLSNVDRVLKNTDEEGVHDLRVSIRRFTAALRIFSRELGRKRVRKVRRQLRMVMTAAGGVRDRDIALQLLNDAGVPPDSDLVATVNAQLLHARAELQKAIGRIDHQEFAGRLEL